MTDPRDPYEVLGVPRTATMREIRAAYLARARTVHPDLVGGRGLDGMRALNEAWAILKDERRRFAHDAALGLERSGVPGHRPPAGSRGDPPAAPRHGAERPFWTGAMGPPPGRPSGSVLAEGIFAGWSIGEIARRDRGYLAWLRDRPEGKALRAEIERVLEPTASEQSSERVRRR